MTVYNTDINAADLAGNIPVEIATEIWESVPSVAGVAGSAVFAKARRISDMSSKTKTRAVTDLLPIAYFRAAGAIAQTTEQKWKDVTMTAEELDVIVPVELTAFDDSNQPVWDMVKPRIIEAVGAAIDAALLYGTGIPASWTTALGGVAGGIAGRCAGASGNTVSLAAFDDIYAAVNDDGGLLAKIEADGYMNTGAIAHTAVKGKIRGARDANGQPLFPGGEIDGVPVTYPLNGAIAATPYMIAGQWSELLFSVRQDISWMIANQGVIQDGNGAIQYNLFQQRMIALMVTFRAGVALPNAVNAIEPTAANRCPFATLTA